MAITRNNTSIYHLNGGIACKLHNTEIVKVFNNRVVLNSGGWQTVTTKRRMNECLKEWGLPISVYQKNHNWFVDTLNGTIPFFDNMEITI